MGNRSSSALVPTLVPTLASVSNTASQCVLCIGREMKNLEFSSVPKVCPGHEPKTQDVKK